MTTNTNVTVHKALPNHIEGNFQQIMPSLEQVLPKHISVETFKEVCGIAIMSNPELAECTPDSLMQAFLRSAKDGLIPDGREAALVIYPSKNGNQWIKKAQYQPMVDGILKRMRMSGEVVNIISKPVYQADVFDYWCDINGENIKFHPNYDVQDRGEFKLVFAQAKLKTGEMVVEVMTKADVDKIMYMSKSAVDRNSGKIKEYSVWAQHYERMAIKTVLHRISRRLPNASEIREMLEREIDIKTFEEQKQEAIKNTVVEQSSIEPLESEKVNFLKGMLKATSTNEHEMLSWMSSKANQQFNSLTELGEQEYEVLSKLLENKQAKMVAENSRQTVNAQPEVVQGA